MRHQSRANGGENGREGGGSAGFVYRAAWLKLAGAGRPGGTGRLPTASVCLSGAHPIRASRLSFGCLRRAQEALRRSAGPREAPGRVSEAQEGSESLRCIRKAVKAPKTHHWSS